jgi:ParB family chromosome partitioning protein
MKGKFILNYDITKYKGADYNPRIIDDDTLKTLQQSIKELGVVKPIIVRNNTIVAGHQRTKALLKIGVTTAPVFLLDVNTNKYDEMRFNQLHNGTDLDIGDEKVYIKGLQDKEKGFTEIEHNDIDCNLKVAGAPIRTEICKLILKYGNWGSCVASKDGEIIHAKQYAMACKMLKINCRIYVINNDEKEKYRFYLDKQYGKFYYEELDKNTFVQTFAQMNRLRKKTGKSSKKDNESTTYKNLIIPYIQKHKDVRILDFGCGHCDYVKELKKQGYNIKGIEFFIRKGNKGLDIKKSRQMVDEVIKDVEQNGLYDIVVCDFVLNSVDSVTAENDVINCFKGFCKKNGVIFFSGRRREGVDYIMKVKKLKEKKHMNRHIEFLDKNGFSALYRHGYWFYQKFHYKKDIEDICKKSTKISKRYTPRNRRT